MNLLIMGAPGAGKGSMSRRIVDKYKVVHVSTGDMLRAAIKEQTPVGKRAQEYVDNGLLVPDEVIHDIIVERLSQDDIKKGFLFDGYPRTYAQAVDLDGILKQLNLNIDKVIYLEIKDEVIAKRITGRRVCKDCDAIYHIDYKPSKVEGVCDVCGGELLQRKDDTLESLNIRLSEYHKNTEPVIDFYKKASLVANINSEQAREEVFADIEKALEACE